MPSSIRDYERPADLPTALELLSEPGAAALMFGPRVPAQPFGSAETAVDLSRLKLGDIRDAKSVIRIGALTTLQALVESPVVQSHAHGLLAEAARLAAPLSLRNLATIGGALQAMDGPPEVRLALMVLDATHVLDDPLSEIILPHLPGSHLGISLERVARTLRDEAIVAVAVKLSRHEGVCRNVRVAIAGAHGQPARLTSVEAALDGNALTAEQLDDVEAMVVADSQPISDFRASAEYRKAMAGMLVKRALENAWTRAALG
jgi:CO/xanthine dehydrogenase FAD-binding subunit